MRLDRFRVDGEDEARERTWAVVREAFEQREPVAWPRRHVRGLAVAVAFATVAAAALSPPGRGVLDDLREAVGVERAAPALESLPAPGRLLVVSAGGGAWIVRADGSRRRLGDYDDAQWSPGGRFVVATRRNELLALEPGGDVRWSLSRRDVSRPRWQGEGGDTRIAYLAASGLRLVAGDGTGDRLLAPFGGLPAWRPGVQHVLSYTDGRAFVVLREVDTGRVLWGVAQGRETPIDLIWSSDGHRLAVVSAHAIRFLDVRGRLVRTARVRGLVVNAAFRPGSHVLAVHIRHEPPGAAAERGRRSEISLVDADDAARSRSLFAGVGVFGEIAWSPNARWLLVDWRTADQWLFLGRDARSRVIAVGKVARTFARDGDRPALLVLDRWIR